MTEEKAGPDNIFYYINDLCDLDQAFEALEGWNHFFTDVTRGRIRSFQLSPKEAWQYFERAEARIGEFENSLRNTMRRFCLKAYSFENALIEESLPGGGDPVRTRAQIYAFLLEDFSNIEEMVQMRTLCYSLYLFHQEDYQAAATALEEIVEATRNSLRDERAGVHLIAAAARHELGDEEAANQHLENACLWIPTLKHRFNMGLYAGVAIALLRMWQREDEAQEWEGFLDNLKVPQKTAALFRQRLERILERSASLKRTFLF